MMDAAVRLRLLHHRLKRERPDISERPRGNKSCTGGDRRGWWREREYAGYKRRGGKGMRKEAERERRAAGERDRFTV